MENKALCPSTTATEALRTGSRLHKVVLCSLNGRTLLTSVFQVCRCVEHERIVEIVCVGEDRKRADFYLQRRYRAITIQNTGLGLYGLSTSRYTAHPT